MAKSTDLKNPFDEFEDAPVKPEVNPFDEFEDAPVAEAAPEEAPERSLEGDVSWADEAKERTPMSLTDYHIPEAIRTATTDILPVLPAHVRGLSSVAGEIFDEGPIDYYNRKSQEQEQVRKTLEQSQQVPEHQQITEQNLADQGIYKDHNFLKNLRDAYYRGRDDYHAHTKKAFKDAPATYIATSLGVGIPAMGAVMPSIAAAKTALDANRYTKILSTLLPRTTELPKTAGFLHKAADSAADAAAFGAMTGADKSEGRLADGWEGIKQIASDTARGAIGGAMAGGAFSAATQAAKMGYGAIKDMGKQGYDFFKQTGKDFTGANVDEFVANLSKQLRDDMSGSVSNLEGTIAKIEGAVDGMDQKQAFGALVSLRDSIAGQKISKNIEPSRAADQNTLLGYLDNIIDARGKALAEATEAGVEKAGKAITKGQVLDESTLAQVKAKADSEVAEATARQNILTPDEPVTDINKVLDIPEIDGRKVFTQKSDLIQGQPEGTIQRLGDEVGEELQEPVAKIIKTKDITPFTPSPIETKVVNNRPVTQAIDITTGKPISTVVGDSLPQNQHDIQNMSSEEINGALRHIKDNFTEKGQIKDPQFLEEMSNFVRVVREGLEDRQSEIYRKMVGDKEVAPNLTQLKSNLDILRYNTNRLGMDPGKVVVGKDPKIAQQEKIFSNILDVSPQNENRLKNILEEIRGTDPALADKYTPILKEAREYVASSRNINPQMDSVSGGGYSTPGLIKAIAKNPASLGQRIGSKIAKTEAELGPWITEKTRAPKEWFEGVATDLRQRYPTQLAAVEAGKQLLKAASSAPAQRAAILKNLYSQPGMKAMLDPIAETTKYLGSGIKDSLLSKDEQQ